MKKVKDDKKKETRKDNLVNVANEVIKNYDGEIKATDNKVDTFESAVYDTDILNTNIIITGVRFAKEGEIKKKKVYYFLLTATKKSREVINILSNHGYIKQIVDHLRNKKTGLKCQIKYNKDREFYYLAKPDKK